MGGCSTYCWHMKNGFRSITKVRAASLNRWTKSVLHCIFRDLSCGYLCIEYNNNYCFTDALQVASHVKSRRQLDHSASCETPSIICFVFRVSAAPNWSSLASIICECQSLTTFRHQLNSLANNSLSLSLS